MTDFKNVEKGPGWKSPGVTLVSDVFRVQYLSQSKDEVSFNCCDLDFIPSSILHNTKNQ